VRPGGGSCQCHTGGQHVRPEQVIDRGGLVRLLEQEESAIGADDVDIGLRIRARGRIVYDPGLFVRFSVRRLEKHGYARTLWTWLRGDVKLLAGRNVDAASYARQKY